MSNISRKIKKNQNHDTKNGYRPNPEDTKRLADIMMKYIYYIGEDLIHYHHITSIAINDKVCAKLPISILDNFGNPIHLLIFSNSVCDSLLATGLPHNQGFDCEEEVLLVGKQRKFAYDFPHLVEELRQITNRLSFQKTVVTKDMTYRFNFSGHYIKLLSGYIGCMKRLYELLVFGGNMVPVDDGQGNCLAYFKTVCMKLN